MDGLSRVAGIGPTIRLGGETLTVHGRTLRHYAELEAEIIRLRGDPFDLIRKRRKELSRLGDELVEKLFNQIDVKWRIVRIEEIHEWLSSLSGRVFSIWQAIRHNGEKHTLDWTTETLSRSSVKWAQMEKAVNQASGLDELGTLGWLNKTTDTDDGREIEWMLLFKRLAKEPYNIHPQQVLDLTMNQIWMLTHSDDEIRSNPIFHRDSERNHYFVARRNKISSAARNLMKGNHWHAE